MTQFETRSEGLVFNPVIDGESLGEMQTPMWGTHSAPNILAAVGALWEVGLTAEELCRGFASFAGVKRRMEVLGKPRDIVVVDDFGHHPTAIRLTLEGARKRWPNQRIWAFFEPRSATSRRNIFQSEFTDALRLADCVVVGSHPRLSEIPEGERFSPQAVAADLERSGKLAKAIVDVQGIVEFVVQEGQPNDVLMIFSNGDFGGLHSELLRALSETGAPL
jgi:UDP-N-acetylmuramate: L-alanyl-gamma-D-glutamyl-meso-diaminopimelate ligase